MRDFTFGSLFAGIGGMDLGLERAGMKCAWQVEIDDYATRVLEKHWPAVPRYRDVREVGKHNLKPVDLVAGGFPCQDISNAGKRAGIEGEQSGLWREMFRIVGELRPRFALVENVSALSYRGLARVVADLTSIRYDSQWSVVPACSVGAPHMRKRMFVVAYPQGFLCDGLQINGIRGGESMGKEREPGGRDPAEVSRGGGWMLDEPPFCRAVDGVSQRVDRLRGLGNAVVPQVAEWIGRRVLTGFPASSV